MSKLSGKDGQILHNAVAIIIDQWESTITQEHAETTASDNYDSASGLVWKAQIPTTAQVELSVEGPWSPVNHAALLTQISNATTPTVAVIARYATNSNAINGSFNIQEITITEPIADTVRYSATLVSNGKVTLT